MLNKILNSIAIVIGFIAMTDHLITGQSTIEQIYFLVLAIFLLTVNKLLL